MRLRDLNRLVEKKNFFGIKKDLEKHIDKLEDDAKEVNLNTVQSFENLAKKAMEKVDKMKDQQNHGDLPLSTDFDSLKNRLNKFQSKFLGFINEYKDNEFQKEIMGKVRKHLEELVADIEDSIDDIDKIEDKILDLEDISKELEKETGGKAKLKRKVAKGMAQDIETKKHKIFRNNKK